METKKKLLFPIIVICIGLVLCISLAGIFFSLVNSQNISNSTSNLSSTAYNIYLLSLNSCKNESEAISLGKDTMINDNAGYLWEYDGNFEIISSAYKNENDALLMKNALEMKNIKTQIIKVDFPSIKISSTYSNKEMEILISALNSFHDAYFELYDISISLDSQIINETKASLLINEVLSKFTTKRNNFNTLFPKNSSDFLLAINDYLTNGFESLSLLFDKILITPTQTFSSLIKYRYCEILDLNYNLIKEIINLNS